MPKQILITGGNGLIGRNMIKYLINDNSIDKIIVCDNFISSDRNDFDIFKSKYDNDNKIILFEYDICNSEDMEYIKLNFHFNEIYHLASLASPIFYKKFPIETLDTSYIGTKNILEIARYQSKYHEIRVLFSSTSETYGDPEISPQNEKYYGNVNSFGERSSYDEGKRVAEALCYTYIHKYNLDIKIARIFNTYGPEMLLNDGRIISETIKHLMNNTTLKIYGDGNQTRSCCYVLDTVDMLVKLTRSNCNSPVNIGNNQELTINETINIIEKVYQEHFDKECKLKRQNVKLTQNDPLKRQPCLIKNKIVLGNRKYISFRDGILKTIEYYMSQVAITPFA